MRTRRRTGRASNRSRRMRRASWNRRRRRNARRSALIRSRRYAPTCSPCCASPSPRGRRRSAPPPRRLPSSTAFPRPWNSPPPSPSGGAGGRGARPAPVSGKVKTSPRRTAMLKEAVVADFLSREFYTPILTAAARHHHGAGHLHDMGGIYLNNLLGDAVSFSGDVSALVALAHDIRRALQSYGRRLENESATGTVSRSIAAAERSEEHTSELQSQSNLVCRLLLEKKNIPPSTCGPAGGSGIPLQHTCRPGAALRGGSPAALPRAPGRWLHAVHRRVPAHAASFRA